MSPSMVMVPYSRTAPQGPFKVLDSVLILTEVPPVDTGEFQRYVPSPVVEADFTELPASLL